jgi:hypothetical protein
MNKHRGEAEVPGVGALRYDWDRIARLIDTLGPDFDAKISQAMATTDIATLAKVVAIGIPGCTPADVREVSPPILATHNAIRDALNLAFHGKREGAPGDPDENPPRRRSIWSRVLATLRLRRD